jgi:predicted GNAT family acetyltransferase
MTPEEVEASVHHKTHTSVPVQTLVERDGDAVAYLSYSINHRNQLTIWHTEVPAALQHLGVGGRLVEQALALARSAGATLRLVCPFAKDHLVRHPELRDQSAVIRDAVIERESLTSGAAFS